MAGRAADLPHGFLNSTRQFIRCRMARCADPHNVAFEILALIISVRSTRKKLPEITWRWQIREQVKERQIGHP